jgi:hypothetical protein
MEENMNRLQAVEYSESIGQIGAGWWRQIAWAESQGIPKALGMDTHEWVQCYVGGHIKLGQTEFRNAVEELTAQGMSQRRIAAVLGVGPTKVREEQQTARKRAEPASDGEEEEEQTARKRAVEASKAKRIDMEEEEKHQRALQHVEDHIYWVMVPVFFQHDVAAFGEWIADGGIEKCDASELRKLSEWIAELDALSAEVRERVAARMEVTQ